jgi:hypothetical protein
MNKSVRVGEQIRSGQHEQIRSGRFGMLTEELLVRKDISSNAKIVYAVMKRESFRAPVIYISNARIAERSGLHRQHIAEYLKQLENVGLIEKYGEPVQQIRPYRFTDVEVGSAATVEVKSNRKTIATLKACGRCQTPCKPSKLTGWCKRCNEEARNQRITREMVREEVAKAL